VIGRPNFRAERERLAQALLAIQADLPRMTPAQLTAVEVSVREVDKLLTRMNEIEGILDSLDPPTKGTPP
jgi:hypothetical protein